LDVYTRTLKEHEALKIPAKAEYYPNVHISVHALVGEEKSLVPERKEPRLLQ